MKNVEMRVEGKTLLLKVDLSKRLGPSKSGKTTLVATTEGIVNVGESLEVPVSLGLNVFVPRGK